MAQQTAVDYFKDELIKKGFFVPGGIYAQAKEIEKEHIINAANITMEQRLFVDPIYKDCGEQYYNETYKL